MRFWTNLFRRSSSRESIFVPRLSTSEEITTMAVKMARKMKRASRNLELAFTAFDVGTALYWTPRSNYGVPGPWQRRDYHRTIIRKRFGNK